MASCLSLPCSRAHGHLERPLALGEVDPAERCRHLTQRRANGPRTRTLDLLVEKPDTQAREPLQCLLVGAWRGVQWVSMRAEGTRDDRFRAVEPMPVPGRIRAD